MTTATETIRVLRRFKNAILEGPPGTGKTHVITEIAAEWATATGRRLIGNGTGAYAITFHPSTTYEEFVEGLRYNDETQQFERRDGFLRNIIREATDHPEADFLVLLDEINRANVPKVLGDVLLCMESTKRSNHDAASDAWGGGVSVTLPYSGSIFSIPSNIYLLGTMNTSDRSIAPLDSALRRRFGFVRVNPLAGDALSTAIEAADGEAARQLAAASVDALTNLNSALRECLGPDAMLGHSYLFGLIDSPLAGGPAVADPLEVVRSQAADVGAVSGFWLEVASTSGGSGNQLDIPDRTASRIGLRERFYPMGSNGHVIATPSPRAAGAQDAVDIHFHGALLVRNTLEYNSGGSNYRFKYQGKTADQSGIYSFTPRDSLAQKVHVFLRRPDSTLDLILLDRESVVVTALRDISTGVERTTPGASGREYGELDMQALASGGAQAERTPHETAVWMAWRYAILPQLIDTATQLGVPDVLDPASRDQALDHLDRAALGSRFAVFDSFLAELDLYLTIEGHGLSRGVAVSENPVRSAAPASDSDGALVPSPPSAEAIEPDEDT